jgi:carbamoyltransferase
MTYILGLNLFHADSSACIFKDAKLICAVEEERFTRIKHFAGVPTKSIEHCLSQAGIKLEDLERIVVNQDSKSNLFKKILFLLTNKVDLNFFIERIKNRLNRKNKNILITLNEKFGKFSGSLDFVDHHQCHLASAYYPSGFKEAVAISVDGFGDFCSTVVAFAYNDKIDIKKKIYFPHSLGIFYQALTQFLGFKNYGDEYKVMGLAPYGELNYLEKIRNLVKINHNKNLFELELKYFVHHKENINFQWKGGSPVFKDIFSNELIELLGEPRKHNDPLLQKHKDIAKATQQIYEEVFFHILRNAQETHNCENLVLAGGCGMNSSANGKILQNTKFKNIYIPSNPGDGGGAVGAAISKIEKKYLGLVANNNFGYTGIEYESATIEEAIDKFNLFNNFRVEKLSLEKLINNTTNHLINLNIIGWFQGKMEWGPRALGNRSILADPRNLKIRDLINLKIKKREIFRPFAPAIIDEYVQDWFDIPNNELKTVPFMSEVYKIKKEKQILIPAVTHIDGTGRLQTVSKKNNEIFYLLIKNFFEKTGVPILLNTSFNENEPIVNTPNEAISCFLRTKMDVIVLGNWIVSRK